MSLLQTIGLSKSYGDFCALEALDLTIAPGEVFGLLGPNGAGKTTTIRLLMGLLRPTSGTARIADLDCFSSAAAVKRYVGWLPDEPGFPAYLRGQEILRFAGRMHGLSPATIASRAERLLQLLQLEDASEEFAVNYSQGMRKKLALVAALIHDPPLLLLDEPTAGLDPYATRRLHALIAERVEQGHSVLISTHLLDQAERYCSRVGILSHGRLAALGPLDVLRAQAGLSATASLMDLFFAFTGERFDPEAHTQEPR